VISVNRSLRPSAQRYSIATLRPSIQPRSRSRCTNAAVHWLCAEGVFWPTNPMVGRSTACASTGHSPFAADTIGRAHCPFGTGETARRAGSCRAARARCPSGPIPSHAVSPRFRQASR
jgi:hypothetical protein